MPKNQAIRKEEIHRILIRGTNWVGDSVMSLPAIASIRRNFPEAAITILVKPWVQGLYSYCPDIDTVMILDRQRGKLASSYQVIKDLKKQQFDLSILLQNAFEAALLTFLAGIPYRVGYNTDGRSWLLSHSVPVAREILEVHQVHYYLNLMKSLGWETGDCSPRIVIPAKRREEAEHFLRKKGIEKKNLLLGFNPGAFYGSAKCWLPERYAALADKAAQQWGAQNIIFGTAHDMPMVKEMVEHMQTTPFLAVGETSLEELIALISMCSLFITNDSGPMHIAAAIGIPVVAIFGSTDPVTTAPYGNQHTVIRHQVSCAPCLRRVCPKDHQCMELVTTEEVWRVIEEKAQRHLFCNQN